MHSPAPLLRTSQAERSLWQFASVVDVAVQRVRGKGMDFLPSIVRQLSCALCPSRVDRLRPFKSAAIVAGFDLFLDRHDSIRVRDFLGFKAREFRVQALAQC